MRRHPTPVPGTGLDTRQILVRVPDQLHAPAPAPCAVHGAGADADHPEVVGVDEIGLQRVDDGAEGELVVPQVRFEPAPATVAEQGAPHGRTEPLRQRVGVASALHQGELAVPEADPAGQDTGRRTPDQEPPPLGGPTGQQIGAPRLDPLPAVLRDAAAPVGEEPGQYDPAVVPAAFREGHHDGDQPHFGVTDGPAVPVTIRGLPEEHHIPAGVGHGTGGLLYAGVTVDGVVHEHDDPSPASAASWVPPGFWCGSDTHGVARPSTRLRGGRPALVHPHRGNEDSSTRATETPSKSPIRRLHHPRPPGGPSSPPGD